MVKVDHIKLNMAKCPSGTDGMPKVSWKIESDIRNMMQTAYHIQISEDRDFKQLVKDTGWVMSEQSVHVTVKDVVTRPLTKYYVRVRTEISDGSKSAWSAPAHFITAADERLFKAAMITAENEADAGSMCGTIVRKGILMERPVRSAYMCATAFGLYHLYINGRKVSDARLAPGWTVYPKHLLYQIYDVTQMLKDDNIIEAVLGPGWYKGTVGYYGKSHHYGSHTAFLAMMKLTFDDGSVQYIMTDETWKGTYANVLTSEIYNGETYDALAVPKGWHPVRTVGYDSKSLCPQESGYVKVHEEITAKKIFYTPKGQLCIDFGQNMAGWVRFRVSAKSGDQCVLHYFETLDKDGNAYFENLREAKQTDCYICRGDGEEVYEPLFTFHGFRYVHLEAWPGQPSEEMFTACAVYTDMEEIGHFECSDPLVNQLAHNILWGMKSNFVDIPSDCPQRDERLGWTGDAQIFAGTAAGLMNVCNFFKKWLKDLALEQHDDGGIPHVIPDMITGSAPKGDMWYQNEDSASGWADAAVIIPWKMYLYYGDEDIIRRQFASMKAWIDYMAAHTTDHVFGDKLQMGDWVALDASEGSYFGATPTELTCMAYNAYVVKLFSKMADIIGEKEISRTYRQQYEDIREAFIKKYFNDDGTMTVQTQTAHVLALYFGLTPKACEAAASDELVSLIAKYGGHLVTGFMGTPYICFALSDFGHEEEACRLLLKDDFPSWLYQVKKGATTVWEHWDGIKEDGTMWSADMNSFNHYAYGSVGEWLFTRLAGISPCAEAAGFKTVLIEPVITAYFKHVSYEYQSVYGKVAVRWEISDGKVCLDICIPVNTKARLRLHTTEKIVSDGLKFAYGDDDAEADAGSGNYHIEYEADME